MTITLFLIIVQINLAFKTIDCGEVFAEFQANLPKTLSDR